MSLITDDPEHSPRDCSRASNSMTKHHHHHHRRRRRLLIAASSTVASLLSLALILWLALRPSSPRFSLLAATVTLGPAAITVDAALTAHNPNAHATALYDQLRASASYAGVALGGAGAPLPPMEQPDQGDAVLSALLTSPSPSSKYGGRAALLRVRVEGQLRWRVAAWVSGRHRLTVDCIAVLTPSPEDAGQQGWYWSSSSPSTAQCATHVLQ